MWRHATRSHLWKYNLLVACAASHAAGPNSASHFKSDIYDQTVLNLKIYFNYTFNIYNRWHNMLAILVILALFENWSSGKKVALYLNRIFQIGRTWQTSRLYSEPCWTIFELLDPQILRLWLRNFVGNFPFIPNIMVLILDKKINISYQ